MKQKEIHTTFSNMSCLCFDVDSAKSYEKHASVFVSGYYIGQARHIR